MGNTGLNTLTSPNLLPPPLPELDGEGYFYTKLGQFRRCSHTFSCLVLDYNSGIPAFCGLCWLSSFFQGEVPHRLHQYKVLAENGNPEVSDRFWAHLETQMGLEAPKPGQSLHEYRLARERLYGRPSKKQYPVTFSLWKMMGTQPKIARPLLRSLWGASTEELATDFRLSSYQVHTTLGKGVRMALRNVRT